MLRFFAGVASALLLVAASFFLWTSRAQRDPVVPPAPDAPTMLSPLKRGEALEPPAAAEKTREEKRFARADKDKDGRITRDELMLPRRAGFAKLDGDGDGRLSFEEWAVRTGEKFGGADADRSGWLTAAEYETTKARPAPRKRCAC
jgi:hypothetical protein